MALVVVTTRGGTLESAERSWAPRASDRTGPLEAAAAELSSEDSATAITLVSRSTGFYVPPHVGGDKEYDGHGPNVSLQVELAVFNDNELWAAVTMDALEIKSDWTRASGTAWYRLHTAKEMRTDVERLSAAHLSSARRSQVARHANNQHHHRRSHLLFRPFVHGRPDTRIRGRIERGDPGV